MGSFSTGKLFTIDCAISTFSCIVGSSWLQTKPQTYVNNSNQLHSQFCNFYETNHTCIVIMKILLQTSNQWWMNNVSYTPERTLTKTTFTKKIRFTYKFRLFKCCWLLVFIVIHSDDCVIVRCFILSWKFTKSCLMAKLQTQRGSV